VSDSGSTGSLWTPGDTIDSDLSAEAVLESYFVYLETCHRDRWERFKHLRKDDRDAALAEAVVFSWMQHERLDPEVAENPSTGGVDFRCTPRSASPFLLEATSLKSEAVTSRSGWPDHLDEVARSFAMVTPNLWSKARKKAGQLAGAPEPRVLAVCSTHAAADVLLGTIAAEWFMTFEPMLAVGATTVNVTDLRKAAFLQVQDGAVVPSNQSISAVLLIAISNACLDVVGLLHPVPAIPFEYRALASVPFLRARWPIQDDIIQTEWVIGHPKPQRRWLQRVELTDKELRARRSPIRCSRT